jgi:uncharacterized protein
VSDRGPVSDRGLSPDGTIAREGSLTRVQEAFRPVAQGARDRILAAFGGARLHSGYLYGSVPRGTARPGSSDLDLVLALSHQPTDADRAEARALESALDASFPQIHTVGILLFSTQTLLSDLERYDLGFFVACLCTPLLGPDLARQLPRYRPDALLARETNGDLALVLPGWRARAAAPGGRVTLSRIVARRLVRTGFTLVMPRWGGWTSDLTQSAELFGAYYPERAEQMRAAARLGLEPADDPATLHMLIDDLGPWLAAEYTAVHGEKAPRP